MAKVPKPPPKAPAGDGSATAPAVQRSKEAFRAATGTDNLDLQDRILHQVLSASKLLKSPANGMAHPHDSKALLAALEAIAPRNGIEGMLAAQMVSTHEAIMECLGRGMLDAQTFAGRDMNLKHAEKLLQIYARQVEVLDKHRGKGQQKITVEHVTVEAGGQAIVGNVNTDRKAQSASTANPRALIDDSAANALSRDALEQMERVKKPVAATRRK